MGGKPKGVVWKKGGAPQVPPGVMIYTLDGMMDLARTLLKLHDIGEQSEAFHELRDSLNVNKYQAAVSRALRAHNIPKAGIAPHPKGSGDKEGLAIYREKLDLYGAVLILDRAPRMKAQLEGDGWNDIPIGEACELAEQYALLFLTRFVINVGGKLTDEGRAKGRQVVKDNAAKRNLFIERAIRDVFTDPNHAIAYRTPKQKAKAVDEWQRTQKFPPLAYRTILDRVRAFGAALDDKRAS